MKDLKLAAFVDSSNRPKSVNLAISLDLEESEHCIMQTLMVKSKDTAAQNVDDWA